MIVYGVDPGQKGGIARINGALIDVRPMSDIADFATCLSSDMHTDLHVWLEKAQSMPKQHAGGMFSYGVHYGELRGMLITLRIPFTEVRPQTWTKVIHAGTKGGVPKARTLEAVRKLFPKVSLIPPGCRVPHMGIVDALAIAEHGRRILRA